MELVKYAAYLLVFMSAVLGKGKNKKKFGNQCTVRQGGCSYQITLTGTTCANEMQADGVYGFERINHSNSTLKNSIDDQDSIDDDMYEQDLEEIGKTGSDEEVPIRKLEVLEKKLIKMMEGLSIRSLRHIRQIRNDLKKMSESINTLKSPGPNGLAKPVECPQDFLSVGTATSCYRFSTFTASWHSAREYCAAFGADLVAPDTLKESYILDYLIKSNQG